MSTFLVLEIWISFKILIADQYLSPLRVPSSKHFVSLPHDTLSPEAHSQDVFQFCLEKSWENKVKLDNAMLKRLRAQFFFPFLAWPRCFSWIFFFSYRSGEDSPFCSSPEPLVSTFHRRIRAGLSAHCSVRRGSKPRGCWCSGWLLFSWGFPMDNFTVQKLLNNHWVVQENGEKSFNFH